MFSKSKLKARRHARDLTQRTLAEAVGVHVHTVRTWEGNRHNTAPNGSAPRPEHLKKLCEVLGCEPEELLEQPDDSAKESADYREGSCTAVAGGDSG